MYNKKRSWSFSDKLDVNFEKHFNQSIPYYKDIHNIITEISGFYLKELTNVYDLGISEGEVFKNLIYEYGDNYNLIGIDNCENMLNNLKIKNEKIKLINSDLNNGFKFENASLITSVLTLQFLNENNRFNLLGQIYEGLMKGSAFILVEKVYAENSKINAMYSDIYHDFKLNNGLSEVEVLDKNRSLRGVMNCLTLNDNLKMLNDVGFKKTDIVFKYNNFVVLLAVK